MASRHGAVGVFIRLVQMVAPSKERTRTRKGLKARRNLSFVFLDYRSPSIRKGVEEKACWGPSARRR